MLFAWIVFDQLPDLLTTSGMLIIGGSCLSIALCQTEKMPWVSFQTDIFREFAYTPALCACLSAQYEERTIGPQAAPVKPMALASRA